MGANSMVNPVIRIFSSSLKHNIQGFVFTPCISHTPAGHILRKSGHADNPATFAPCVKSMAAGLIAKFTMFPTGDCPKNSLDESLLLRKSSMKNTK